MSSGRWVLAVTAVLVAVFVAIGWIQTRQSQRIDSTIAYNEENVSWIFFQLEYEYTALRDSLRQARRYPQAIHSEALRERYEIFVSRVSLVQSMQLGSPEVPLPDHPHTSELIRQFIGHADPFLSENSPSTLNPDVIANLLSEMEPLGGPIHDLSLLTIEMVGKTVSTRNAAAREQVHISIALNIFQALLTLVFAAMLIRQVRSLEKRSHELGRAKDEILILNSELEDRVRQRTVQLEAANQALQAFSYSVSHDLRAPLKTIDGFSHLLERVVADKMGEKGKHYLNRIRTGVQCMGELIDGLLSLAQLSRDTLQFSQVDLSAMARRIAQECQEEVPYRQAEIRIQDAMAVTGDRRLLLVVMQNLLVNAWKFTSKRELTRIEIGSKTGAANETVYFVKDNGAGFDMAYAEKLFGTFERLHSPSDFAGTGIGLATVKRVIERHGGRVWAEGKVNDGAVFYFTLGGANVSG
ncbi:MAG: ATP-binding protein [Polaromonas sp.]